MEDITNNLSNTHINPTAKSQPRFPIAGRKRRDCGGFLDLLATVAEQKRRRLEQDLTPPPTLTDPTPPPPIATDPTPPHPYVDEDTLMTVDEKNGSVEEKLTSYFQLPNDSQALNQALVQICTNMEKNETTDSKLTRFTGFYVQIPSSKLSCLLIDINTLVDKTTKAYFYPINTPETSLQIDIAPNRVLAAQSRFFQLVSLTVQQITAIQTHDIKPILLTEQPTTAKAKCGDIVTTFERQNYQLNVQKHTLISCEESVFEYTPKSSHLPSKSGGIVFHNNQLIGFHHGWDKKGIGHGTFLKAIHDHIIKETDAPPRDPIRCFRGVCDGFMHYTFPKKKAAKCAACDLIYEGSVLYGVPHMFGRIWDKEYSYHGGLHLGKRDGVGEEETLNNGVYVGCYQNDLKNGFGVMLRRIDDNTISEWHGLWKDGEKERVCKQGRIAQDRLLKRLENTVSDDSLVWNFCAKLDE